VSAQVGVGRGRATHTSDGRAWPTSRTLCGLAWTDEHPAEAPTTCATCASKLAAARGAASSR
jgi:hypothetical protein